MDGFLELVVSNSLVAAAFAVGVAVLSRLRVSPAVLHTLWLLVLVKLFMPPLLPIALGPPADQSFLATAPPPAAHFQTSRSAHAGDVDDRSFAQASAVGISWVHLLFGVWGIGIVLSCSRLAARFASSRRLMRHRRAVPAALQTQAEVYCHQLDIRRCPELFALPVHISPAVWSLGKPPCIVLPAELVEKMEFHHLKMIILHELAHIRRKDHLVRFFELLASTIFWWHPVVWWVRHQLREAEELCCDQLVRRVAPEGVRSYAMALIEALEFLCVRPGPRPIGSTAASPEFSLKRRIEMLKYTPTGASKWRGIALGAALCFPAMTIAFAVEPPRDKEPAARPARHATNNASDSRAQADNVFPEIYNVSDLPVWTERGEKFDPSLLVFYVRLTVAPDAWEQSSTIQVYAGNASLVISTTKQNHAAIADVLRKLRGQGGGE